MAKLAFIATRMNRIYRVLAFTIAGLVAWGWVQAQEPAPTANPGEASVAAPVALATSAATSVDRKSVAPSDVMGYAI